MRFTYEGFQQSYCYFWNRMLCLKPSGTLCNYLRKQVRRPVTTKCHSTTISKYVFPVLFENNTYPCFQNISSSFIQHLMLEHIFSVYSYLSITQPAEWYTVHPHGNTIHWLIWVPFGLPNFIKQSPWWQLCSYLNYMYLSYLNEK